MIVIKMNCYLLLVLNLALASAVSLKQKTKESNEEIVDIGKDKDILEINKDLTDDIIVPNGIQRSSVNVQHALWRLPVAYILENDLELNAKGVILRSLDQFRLKSCIDFKPREDEDYYISVQKLGGCFSYVGRTVSNGQVLSIGKYCDTNAIVEHEFLHALGFNHEQSRYDRDEFVTIQFENILKGYEYNFQKLSKEYSTTHGVPYDYTSVMHYGPYAFSNGSGPTIITKDPAFQDIIGQRLEVSPSDVKELNLLYKCNSTVAFLMHCSFSDGSTCQMNRCSQRSRGWENVTQAPGGPATDRTNLISHSKMQAKTPSSFMHVSTAVGQEGDSAWLETKRMTPSRECYVQCLQFYYFHSGNEADQLNIWVREFLDEYDFTGQRRQVGQITGQRTSHWQIHHVSLSATKSFQVEFEVRKGAGNSTGGISIDDINLSELECPHVTLQINDFEKLLESSDYGSLVYSQRQYTGDGYAFRVATILYRSFFGLLIQMMEGKNDDKLQWPVLHRQVTFQMLDQNPNIQLQMSKQRSMTSDAIHTITNGTSVWDNPRKFGKTIVDENGQEVYVGPLIGRTYFAPLDEIQQRDFLKGGSAVFVFSVQDLTPLINGSSLPCFLPPKVTQPTQTEDRGPCSSRYLTTTFAPPTPTTPEMTTIPEMTTDDRFQTTTFAPPTTTTPETTTDDSIFGFAPGLVSSAFFTLLPTLLLLLP